MSEVPKHIKSLETLPSAIQLQDSDVNYPANLLDAEVLMPLKLMDDPLTDINTMDLTIQLPPDDIEESDKMSKIPRQMKSLSTLLPEIQSQTLDGNHVESLSTFRPEIQSETLDGKRMKSLSTLSPEIQSETLDGKRMKSLSTLSPEIQSQTLDGKHMKSLSTLSPEIQSQTLDGKHMKALSSSLSQYQDSDVLDAGLPMPRKLSQQNIQISHSAFLNTTHEKTRNLGNRHYSTVTATKSPHFAYSKRKDFIKRLDPIKLKSKHVNQANYIV
jgi:hypothetical protein